MIGGANWWSECEVVWAKPGDDAMPRKWGKDLGDAGQTWGRETLAELG